MRPKKSFGQHFLRRADLLAYLVQQAALQPDDLVLEVGAGPGNLTRHLLAAGARVVAIEIDARFATTPAALGHPSELIWVAADVLASKNAWNPAVVAAIEAELHGRARLVLVANLPYAIATPLLALLAESPWPVSRAIATVQLEVAERLVAVPGGKDYGPISVLLHLAGTAELLRRLGRHAFWPPPKVLSAIVRLSFRPASERASLAAIASVVRALFPYRRKTLRAGLLAAFAPVLTPALADRIAAPFGPARRTETMSPTEFVAIFSALHEVQLARDP
ncbi:MAG: 16S rRNA (adenine(1518)-N(6)/adenine(1519)-N(6))-dimethyltransferase RsmA [Planctomycetota bacterium]